MSGCYCTGACHKTGKCPNSSEPSIAEQLDLLGYKLRSIRENYIFPTGNLEKDNEFLTFVVRGMRVKKHEDFYDCYVPGIDLYREPTETELKEALELIKEYFLPHL